MQKILKALHKSCQTDKGEDDMKKGTQLLEVGRGAWRGGPLPSPGGASSVQESSRSQPSHSFSVGPCGSAHEKRPSPSPPLHSGVRRGDPALHRDAQHKKAEGAFSALASSSCGPSGAVSHIGTTPVSDSSDGLHVSRRGPSGYRSPGLCGLFFSIELPL